jgi:hypothetical protein
MYADDGILYSDKSFDPKGPKKYKEPGSTQNQEETINKEKSQ